MSTAKPLAETRMKTWTIYRGHLCTGHLGGVIEKEVGFSLDILGDIDILSAELKIYAKPTNPCGYQAVAVVLNNARGAIIEWAFLDTSARTVSLDVSRNIVSGENTIKITYGSSGNIAVWSPPCMELEIKLRVTYTGAGDVKIPVRGPRLLIYIYYILLITALVGGGGLAAWLLIHLLRRKS